MYEDKSKSSKTCIIIFNIFKCRATSCFISKLPQKRTLFIQTKLKLKWKLVSFCLLYKNAFSNGNLLTKHYDFFVKFYYFGVLGLFDSHLHG